MENENSGLYREFATTLKVQLSWVDLSYVLHFVLHAHGELVWVHARVFKFE